MCETMCLNENGGAHVRRHCRRPARQELLGDRSRALTARSGDLHEQHNVWAAEQRTSRVTTDARSEARRVRHANRFQLIESREESPGTWTL
jgi:hypothetical protein